MKFILAILPLVALIALAVTFPKWRRRNKGAEGSRELRKISQTTKTFRPGKDWQLLPTNYYFDDENFYEIQVEVNTPVPLSAITKVERDSIKVNNRSFWIVTYTVDGRTKQVRFRHNYTLFNTAFADFLDAVKRANPEASVRELSAFSF
ncbi:hypothetical protein [Advenella mimigardefordensis]|uniref:Uncharacterized protein n=1 Tax=Advenella mimigardefordensis (strain DSM 17166 / LMG 22922 / DPN7) TaxID=1247726 RepID=W0PGH2_ADVMD|nr:hypothetical protein [Advenella mimigardefordensis]AHG64240.1 hypothetical protein MIM_c21610 [Advenella mimigardefordensis DPN7]